MSIIADTLKRLQAQGEDPLPPKKEDVVRRPTFNKGEGSGRHRKDSPFTLLMVMMGMTVTLGGLAIAAFWIGGHLDFGLGTTTQAHGTGHSSQPRALRFSNNQALVDDPPESLVASTLDSNQVSGDLTEVNQDNVRQISAQSPDRGASMPSLLQVENENVDIPSTNMNGPIIPLDQAKISDQSDQPHNDHEQPLVPSFADSEEPLVEILPSGHFTEHTEDPGTIISVDDQDDKQETPNMIALLSEEEILQTEEFVNPINSSKISVTTSQAHDRLNVQRELTKPDRESFVPSQPSSASRLRHAKEMIRAGEYQDAASLLSPLFHDPPVKWQPWFWMGTALLGSNEMDKADQFFLSGLARNDKIPQLWIQRALVAQQRGDYSTRNS